MHFIAPSPILHFTQSTQVPSLIISQYCDVKLEISKWFTNILLLLARYGIAANLAILNLGQVPDNKELNEENIYDRI